MDLAVACARHRSVRCNNGIIDCLEMTLLTDSIAGYYTGAMQDECADVDTEVDEHCSKESCLAAMEGMVQIHGECTDEWGDETGPAIVTLLAACGDGGGRVGCDGVLEAMQTACDGVSVDGGGED